MNASSAKPLLVFDSHSLWRAISPIVGIAKKIVRCVAVVTVVTSPVVYFVWDFNHNNPIAVSERVNERVVNAWLEAQRSGRSGYEFWAQDAERSSLFSVADWEIVDSDMLSVRVRVDSSTQGGAPIRKLWEVRLREATKNGEPDALIEEVREPFVH